MYLNNQPQTNYSNQFSSQGQIFSIAKLTDNLCRLLEEASQIEVSHDQIESFLVGKQVRHRFQDSDKTSQTWSTGKVVGQVQGFPDWFNIVYECDPNVVCTYKLMEEFTQGDLQIVSVAD